MSSNLESEELDGVQLVRMEDVQPARERQNEASSKSNVKNENMETSAGNDMEFENECVVDDDDSNIGSMVSIQSEEMSTPSEEVSVKSEASINCEELPCDEEPIRTETVKVIECDDSSTEMIVPEIVRPRRIFFQTTPKKDAKSVPERWPTLEILPGGVIKRSEKVEEDSNLSYSKEEGNESEGDATENMYACAKCSKSFRYLYCLVKHVRWHEKQQKLQEPDLSKLCTCANGNFECVHTAKRIPRTKANRKKVPKKTKS